MGEAGGAAVLDQAVHLRHAGSRGDQHQRTVGQFRQVRVAERQLDPCQALALQLRDQRDGTVFLGQDVQLKVASRMRAEARENAALSPPSRSSNRYCPA